MTTPLKAPLKALIFDLDGTLADTEVAHRSAFNHAFAEAGLDWHWDELLYTELLGVAGGKERITHYGGRVQAGARALDVQALHDLKTAAYARLVQGGAVRLRPGVLPLIEAAEAEGLQLAIATTTSPANIAALLHHAIGPRWADRFRVVEDAATAPRKKPHPQAYAQALQRLGLPAAQCLAVEDSANGLQAARAAGLATVVTTNAHTAHHDFTGALRVLPSLQGVSVADLRAWHAAAQR